MKETYFGGYPCELAPQTQLSNKPGHVHIAGEEVVVASFQSSATNIKRGCLTAKEGRALEHLDFMPLPKQLKGGSQTCGTTADYPYFHPEPTSSDLETFALS